MATQVKDKVKDSRTEGSPKGSSRSSSSKVAKRTITIRLAKGKIACNPLQRATINGLGLKHREQVRTLENTPAVRGMIKKVLHLLELVSETR
ncbi:MAG: 50S ribosomal protein L30 [Oligoflexia bacterium]